jgi:hypothetical protein
MFDHEFRALIAVEKTIDILSHFVSPVIPSEPKVSAIGRSTLASPETTIFGSVTFSAQKPLAHSS